MIVLPFVLYIIWTNRVIGLMFCAGGFFCLLEDVLARAPDLRRFRLPANAYLTLKLPACYENAL